MRLTVVGAGPAYSDRPGAVGACYLVELDGRALALDLGHGAFAGLASRIRPEALAAVAISHLHPDHFVDLVALRHYLRYHLDPPRRMTVDAHPDLAARLDGLHAQPGFTAGALDIEPLAERTWSRGPFELAARKVTHTTDSYALRVAPRGGGTGLVYSGDVGEAGDVAPLVRPGDALLVEVSFGPGPVPVDAIHLDGPAVARLAATTGAGRVLLTHLLPDRDPVATVASVRAGVAGPVDLVEPGFVMEIGRESNDPDAGTASGSSGSRTASSR